MTDVASLLQAARERADSLRESVPYVASNNDASLALHEAEEWDAIADALEESAREVERLREQVARLDAYITHRDYDREILDENTRLREEAERLRDEVKRLSRVPCGKCHGVGEITLDEQASRVFCPRCEGKGYLTPVEPWRYREREEGD